MKFKKKIKVFILTDLLLNYRVPVFQKLSNLPEIDLTVFYSNPIQRDLKESIKQAEKFDTFKSVQLSIFKIRTQTYQLAFIKYLITQQPDLIISIKPSLYDNILYIFLCKLLGIKFLLWRGGTPYCDGCKIKETNAKLRFSDIFGNHNPLQWLFFRADGMIVYSDHAKQYFTSLGFKRNIFIAPNSPDTDTLLSQKQYFQKNPQIINEVKNKFAPNGEKILFMLGRLNKGRKTDLLLNAYEIIQKQDPNVTLIIIGDGSERNKLEQAVLKKKLNKVCFMGEIYDDNILAQYFAICDIFVVPLASLAINMAMTFGKPVITGNFGLEVHSIKNGENGFIVEVDNPDALAQKILLLMKDFNFYKKISKNAEETILNHININKMIEGFRLAINYIVNNKKYE